MGLSAAHFPSIIIQGAPHKLLYHQMRGQKTQKNWWRHLWTTPQVIMDGKWAAERPTYQLLSWSLNALLNNVNNKLMIVPNMFNFLETSRNDVRKTHLIFIYFWRTRFFSSKLSSHFRFPILMNCDYLFLQLILY